MYRYCIKHRGRVLVLVVIASVLMMCAAPCRADKTQGENASSQSGSQGEPNQKPIIIWFHTIHRDSAKTLEIVFSSGLITHVVIKTAHRKDFALEEFKKQQPRISESVNVAKKFGVKVIWSRSIWPYYVNDDIRLSDYFDPNYYINEIRILRKEAKDLGADYTLLDMEVYAYSPMQRYWRNRFELTPQQEILLTKAVDNVLNTVGQIDFIYPAGYVREKHPANIFGRLGKLRISTSYDTPERLKLIKYPYDIFGFNVDTQRYNKKIPHLPFYLVSDIFEKSQLWSDKKGVFIYCNEYRSEAVARELVKYSKTLPFKKRVNASNQNQGVRQAEVK